MKTWTKVEKAADLAKIPFAGFELTEAKEGSGGTDFKGIVLLDKPTGRSLKIELGQYSELQVYIEKQPEIVTLYEARGKEGSLEIVNYFDDKSTAETWVKEYNETHSGAMVFVITEVKKEKTE